MSFVFFFYAHRVFTSGNVEATISSIPRCRLARSIDSNECSVSAPKIMDKGMVDFRSVTPKLRNVEISSPTFHRVTSRITSANI